MVEMNREHGELISHELCREVVRSVELPQAAFHRYLPGGGGADNGEVGFHDGGPRLDCEEWVVCQPPEKHVCIQQEPHVPRPSNRSTTSSGSSLKSGAMRTSPFQPPGARCPARSV